MINALGSEPSAIWPRLAAGDTTRLSWRDDFVPGRVLLVGAVKDHLPEVPSRLARYACRNNAMTLAALRQIEGEVADRRARGGRHRIGVVVGTSTSGVSDAEQAIRAQQETGSLSREFDYAQLEFGGLAGFVAEHLDVSGPAFTLSTACSSGARALATARSLLRLGVCDAVVAGATDTLCRLTTNGFHALQAIADGVSNPMSVNRRGLTLGEGSALFLVTPEAGGVQLLGVGESSEAHHMSAPDPEGRGAEAAMREALSDAGLEADAIAYLNLHGTGTPQNDSMESAAVHRVLGPEVPASSTKPLVGHALGAAGALEAAFCWLMLEAFDGESVPLVPHRWDGARDPALEAIRLAGEGERARASGRAAVMTNSFGFGGNNCTLVLGAGAVAC
jgi:3-oxoacyl-[acyl-carrier-protein] synthase-1